MNLKCLNKSYLLNEVQDKIFDFLLFNQRHAPAKEIAKCLGLSINEIKNELDDMKVHGYVNSLGWKGRKVWRLNVSPDVVSCARARDHFNHMIEEAFLE